MSAATKLPCRYELAAEELLPGDTISGLVDLPEVELAPITVTSEIDAVGRKKTVCVRTNCGAFIWMTDTRFLVLRRQ